MQHAQSNTETPMQYSKIEPWSDHLARIIGGSAVDAVRMETFIYAMMRRICPQYDGGAWDLYETSNGAFFLCLRGEGDLQIIVPSNWFEGSMSREAASITATCFAAGLYAESAETDQAIELLYRVREVAYAHAEREKILAALD
ncbi:antirestriction protein [Thioalkalivibrio thiocyanodenitrificans]|uniref:antirestriction protein n=1 Tax=Thioalkalivibrio thiocyanodenitrificans TaxID=243063 RepID=UPI0003723D69|nr:antirestriction protein [Thioalkalivibrio thiocyanodenitrificans]